MSRLQPDHHPEEYCASLMKACLISAAAAKVAGITGVTGVLVHVCLAAILYARYAGAFDPCTTG
jgi:hypothetical protein